ncbi:hypothetical protein [Paenibacillus piscarius]
MKRRRSGTWLEQVWIPAHWCWQRQSWRMNKGSRQ